MDLKDMLTQKEIEDFESMACYYQSNAFEGIPVQDYLQNNWANNKEKLFKLFGNKTIISKHIKIDMPDELVEDEFRDLYYDKFSTGAYKLNKLFSERSNMYITINLRTFSKNILSLYDGNTYDDINNYKFKSAVDGKTKQLISGQTKLFKALRMIIKDLFYDDAESMNSYLKWLDEITKEYSVINNNMNYEGEYCLSIHPLDFATMSMNSQNWSSCMNWYDGEYRSGTIEMMCSPYVVIGYLKSNNKIYEDNDIKWNSKIWRSLFIVTDDIITNVKDYPCYSKELNQIGLNFLKELFAEDKYYDSMINEDGDKYNYYIVKYGERIIKINCHYSTYLMYNDMDYKYAGFAYFSKELLDSLDKDIITLHINYGENPPMCLCCGRSMIDSEPDSLVCIDCRDDYHICSECGERIYYDDENLFYDRDGNPYCDYCAENVLFYCNECNEWVRKDEKEKKTVYYYKNELSETPDAVIYICSDCFSYMLENELIDSDGIIDTSEDKMNKISKECNWVYWQCKRYF